MASAVAWSEEDGGGGPTVCQLEDLALRNSALALVTEQVNVSGSNDDETKMRR